MGRKRYSKEVEDEVPQQPKKKYYRSRAHCNPLSHNDGFAYPLSPAHMRWDAHYPSASSSHASLDASSEVRVTVLDIGCGFGGLTVALAELLPDRRVLGMEIRAKVCEFVRLRIQATRHERPGVMLNAACLRTNCMRYLPNYFDKGQLDKIFICFPDPHFKAKNHRRRIVSDCMLTEYAYFLKPGGRLYVVTDVADLHKWHIEKCDAHRSFTRLNDEVVLADDPCVAAMLEVTEEGKKVARNKGDKHFAVYERVEAALERPSALLSLFGESN